MSTRNEITKAVKEISHELSKYSWETKTMQGITMIMPDIVEELEAEEACDPEDTLSYCNDTVAGLIHWIIAKYDEEYDIEDVTQLNASMHKFFDLKEQLAKEIESDTVNDTIPNIPNSSANFIVNDKKYYVEHAGNLKDILHELKSKVMGVKHGYINSRGDTKVIQPEDLLKTIMERLDTDSLESYSWMRQGAIENAAYYWKFEIDNTGAVKQLQ